MHSTFSLRWTMILLTVGLAILMLWGGDVRFASAQTDSTATPAVIKVTAPMPLAGMVSIAADMAGATCAITERGGVECWEGSTDGAVNILGVSEAVVVEGGGQHACVITRSGKVQCWGFNSNGQLGDGTTESTYGDAVDVKGLPGKVSALAGGWNQTCAIVNGDIYCWGENDEGQLGDGTTTDRHQPTKVTGLTAEAVAIGGGEHHVCALLDDGSVWCWGWNIGGQLGNDDDTSSSVPVKVSGLPEDVIAVDGAWLYSCALTRSGSVWCWGDNGQGQLGDGTTTSRETPAQVNNLSARAIAISLGYEYACALMQDGGMACWGDNRSGQLGDGTNIDRLTPVEVTGLTESATAITVGKDYTCALIESGGARCWGENRWNQLGDGTDIDSLVPVNVEGLSGGISGLYAGNDVACAVDGSGLKCWGANDSGQVGDGSDVDQNLPVSVSGLAGEVRSLAIGMMHTCAITSAGVQCWGYNGYGQLGNGDQYASSYTPVQVSGLEGQMSAIAAGAYHTCALSAEGAVLCWGDNEKGQLGDGTVENRSAPVPVSGLERGVTAITAGLIHTCAATDEAVFCWGENAEGQLGDGTTEARATPVRVSGIDGGVVALAASENISCALFSDGAIQCWGGIDPAGRPLDDAGTNALTPVSVQGLPGSMTALAVGLYHICALTENGGVVCWGSEHHHTVTGDANATPVQVAGLESGVTALVSGGYHVCALTGSGVQCWGSNTDGQLGNGLGAHRNTPVTVVLGPRRGEDQPETGSFRVAGPLTPQITTYIPTPLDISTKPSVIGANLFLAALMMLPFAVAAEFFTRVMDEHEASLRRRIRPIDWLGRFQQRLNALAGARLERRPAWRDVARLFGVMFFFGLAFSLLERGWNPFSLKGLILFLSMTIAYGIVGVADDIFQWRALRKWGVAADLAVRPSNFLLAVISTATTRVLNLVPGLMFGTPEALRVDEALLDEDKRNRLLKISVITFTIVGLSVWLPTIGTALLQRLSLPTLLQDLLGGVEGFLLVIFAVTLENLFVQMLGMPGSIGEALKRRGRLLWLIVLVGVTFLFYHTLINPHGGLAEAIRVGNVALFLAVSAGFLVITFGLWLYFKWQDRRAANRQKQQPQSAETPETAAAAMPAAVSLTTAAEILSIPLIPSIPSIPVIPTAVQPEPSPQLAASPPVVQPEPAQPSAAAPGYPKAEAEIQGVEQKPSPPPAIVPPAIPSPAIALAPGPVVWTGQADETKSCPVCGNLIKAEARLCRFCRASFTVTLRGYCLTDHAVVEVAAGGHCVRCQGVVVDTHVESRLSKAPGAGPVAAPQSGMSTVQAHPQTAEIKFPVQASWPTAQSQTAKPRSWLWLVGILAAFLICGVCALGLWLGRDNLSAIARLFETPTSTARAIVKTTAPVSASATIKPTATPTAMPTVKPTLAPRSKITSRPGATATPLPAVQEDSTASPTTTETATAPANGVGTAEGRILWNDQPIAGVTVKLCLDWSMFGGCQTQEYQAITGDDGVYSIPDLPAGEYDFVTRLPDQGNETGWLGVSVQITGGQTTQVRDVSVVKYDLSLSTPTNHATVESTTPTLTWQDYPGADYYRVYVVDNDTYETVVSFETVHAAEYTFATPLGAGEYYWSIDAYNAGGSEISESGYFYFTIAP